MFGLDSAEVGGASAERQHYLTNLVSSCEVSLVSWLAHSVLWLVLALAHLVWIPELLPELRENKKQRVR